MAELVMHFATVLEAKIAQSGMLVRTPAEWPMVFAVRFFDGKIVDARKPHSHQAIVVEFPVFVAVRAIPIP